MRRPRMSRIDKTKVKQGLIDRIEAENKLQDERFASLEQRLLAMEASMN
jgi:hypothetical protein